MAYWRDIRAEAWKQTKTGLASSQRRKTSIGVPIISAIIGIFILIFLHQPIPLTLLIGLMSGLLGYALVVFSDWLGNVTRLPAEIDAQRLNKIRELDAEIQRLKNPEKLVAFQFESLVFGNRMMMPVIILNAKISNRGPNTTLHSIRLSAEDDRSIQLRPAVNQFPRRSIDDIRLASGEVESAFLEFNLQPGGDWPERNWVLEFSDPSAVAHREPIPRELYKRG